MAAHFTVHLTSSEAGQWRRLASSHQPREEGSGITPTFYDREALIVTVTASL
jgi:hypothetical protein